jgi:hypothetical protein
MLQELLLAAVPAYETYLFQLMGKKFPLKMPVERPNPDNIKLTFESVVTPEQGLRKPQRIVLKVEYLRSMQMATLRVEWWPDIEAHEPKAVNEPNLAQFRENLMSPHFVFGWLRKMVGNWAEGVEVENMHEARMQHAEALITKTDEILADHGYVIEAFDYESYADTLDSFLLTARFDEQTESILRKVGDVVRGAAKAYGAAKGAYHGAKQRWQDFKASVKGAYSGGYEKGYSKGRGGGDGRVGRVGVDFKAGDKGAKSGVASHKPIAATAPTKLKSVKGDRPKKERYPGGKMSDTEYKARYGQARKLAASLDAETGEPLDESLFEAEFDSLDTPELLALEAMVELLVAGELEEGTRFKALVSKLKKRGGVRNPAALAAWIGRKKYGAEKFKQMSAAGRKKHAEAAPEKPRSAVGDFRRWAGVVSPTEGWKVP